MVKQGDPLQPPEGDWDQQEMGWNTGIGIGVPGEMPCPGGGGTTVQGGEKHGDTLVWHPGTPCPVGGHREDHPSPGDTVGLP